MGFFDSSLFQGRLFDTRNKLPVHVVQIVLVTACIGLSAPRLFMKNQPRTRANTIALGMGAKSLVIIFYQILSEHVGRFRKWASLKANLILNSLEVVFWAAVVFLVMQGNMQTCVGVGCILSWIVVGLAIVNSIFCSYMAILSYLDFQHLKQKQSGIRPVSEGTRTQMQHVYTKEGFSTERV